jgi:hypothetical protein
MKEITNAISELGVPVAETIACAALVYTFYLIG